MIPRTRPSRSSRSRLGWLLLLCIALGALAATSVVLGSRGVSWSEILGGLTGATDTFGEAAVAKRVPRTLFALLAGGGLAVSGTVLQGITRNPLADPGILGVNLGASLAVVVGIAFFGLTSAASFAWVAIAGAAVAAVAVYTIGSLGRGGATPLKLTLAGAATAAALTSLISAVVLPRGDIADSVRSWQIGGVGGGTFSAIEQTGGLLLAGFVLCLLSTRGLNSLALGDELATGLGLSVARARLVAAVGAVLLCGAVTSVAGPIGFVGLVVPHACRLMVGPDHRWLVPYSALAGAGLLLAADVIGRVVARNGEMEVGIVTAVLGAPFFIHLVRRTKLRAL